MDWLDTIFEWVRSNRALAGTIVGASVFVAIAYVALMFVIIARMSPEYFASREPPSNSWRLRHPVLRYTFRAVKNILGVVFLIAGLAMLVLPGQGALTILVAVGLLDFPGKRRLERRIICKEPVYRSINWIRAKANQPPLVLPERAGGS